MADNRANHWARVCPFCGKVHDVYSPYLNIACECGGKYYTNTGEWMNRNTGEVVKPPRAACGCSKCKQWQVNKEETGYSCLSHAFTRCILTGILEDRDDLSATQKEAFDVVINVLDELNEEERK